MAIQSVLVLGDSGFELNVTSDKVRADGFFGQKDGLHTIAFFLENFTGRIFLEASLETDPQESDWFTVFLDGCNPFVEYPLPAPLNEALEQNASFTSVDPLVGPGSTFVDAYTFVGNFLWLRVKVDRSFVRPIPTTDAEKENLGRVKKVLLNH